MFIPKPNILSIALGTLVLAGSIIAVSVPGKTATNTEVPTDMRVAQAPNIDTAAIEQSVFDQINQYRASQNLKPLNRDPRIDEQARIHSQNMASGQVPFGHAGDKERIEAIGIRFIDAGENVTVNQGAPDPATQAVQDWLKNPEHLARISGKYNLTGIGVAVNPQGAVYFTQIFLLRGT